MKSIYITSVESYSGKTAFSLAVGKNLQKKGYSINYLKPLSMRPRMIAGKIADEDAEFAKSVLQLSSEPWELSAVVLTPDFLQTHMRTDLEIDLIEQVKSAIEKAGAGKDVLLLEGGSTLREGFIVGLPSPLVASISNSYAVEVLRYHDDIQLLDDILAAKTRFGDLLRGIVINRVPPQANPFIVQSAVPYLERHGIPVLGVLPEVQAIAALTVEEVVNALGADVLTRYYRPQALIENLTVGAMTAETALSRFRKHSHKAVITGGDRTDIQLAALETSTTCLILTGNLHPSPLVVKQAEEFGVSVLLVRPNTMEAIEMIESIYGKTRLAHPAKLSQFEQLLDEHLDYDRLYKGMELI